MTHLPGPQTKDTIREWDRRAVEEYGVAGIVLMENAGAGAARIIHRLLEDDPAYRPPALILCGPGNNGGDGFVVARHLANRGWPVELYLAFDRSGLRDASDAAVNLRIVEKMKLTIHASAPGLAPPDELAHRRPCTLVDALFGTGLSRPLEAPATDWVEAIRRNGMPVIALDVPSGLDADSGEVLGAAVRAARTITFAASKKGFTLGRGAEHCGTVDVVDIGLPRPLWARCSVS